MKLLRYLVVIAAGMISAEKNNAQTMKEEIQTQPLQMICDPDSGVCEIKGEGQGTAPFKEWVEKTAPVEVIYFTDPICSSCWGIEPVLRKLKLAYGLQVHVSYHMGGLLPGWDVYNSGGISKPSDVASHWDEVSPYYDMPIDGDVWLEDPLPSSYPPSIAFKAAQLQSEEKALKFLREMRHSVFLRKRNICKLEVLIEDAHKVGLDTAQLKSAMEGAGKSLFQSDLQLAKAYGVRGFPTILVVDTSGNNTVIYGSRPYEMYEQALLKVNQQLQPLEYSKEGLALFDSFSTLTVREYATLAGIPRNEAETYLEDQVKSEKLGVLRTKNGSLYIRKDSSF